MSIAIEGKKSRLVAADNLLQFIECSVHLFLHANNLFPDVFVPHQRFGHTVLFSNNATTRNYVKQFCLSIRNLVLLDRVHSIVVVLPLCRFIIELPSDFCRTVFYALPSQAHRSDLEIASTCAKLLGETLTHMERKLLKATDETTCASFELFVVVKRNAVPGTETPTPSGFQVMANTQQQGWLRSPIKSAILDETVVLSVYADKLVD